MRAPATTIAALCAGFLLAAACGSATKETPPTPDGAAAGEQARLATSAAVEPHVALDDHRYLGAAFDVGNLRVWPVHTDAPLEIGEFLTLQEAQEKGVATVREIGGGSALGNVQTLGRNHRNRSAGNRAVQTADVEIAQEDDGAQQVAQIDGGGATVNSLVIENAGDLPLLVCAGTIVKGGNQDRQIGQDIVVAAGAKVPVDAFCVEPGRWTNVREGVGNSGEFVALKTMTAKDVRVMGQYEDDQSGVWQQVAEVRTRALPRAQAALSSGVTAGARVQTTTLVDAIDKVDETTRRAREDAVAAIVGRFDALAGSGTPPVGFAYAVNGEPQSVRVFAHDRLLRRNLEAFANTMVLEAEVAPEASFTACGGDAVVRMVRAIEKDAEVRRERTAASNVNVLMKNREGFNGNCLVEDPDGKEVPVTQDWTRK